MASEHVCRSLGTEALMDRMNVAVTNAVGCLKRWNFTIVLILSILHVGLAYVHVRDSG